MGPDDGVLGGHPPGAESQAGGDNSRETLRDSGDGKGNGDLEVVDGSLDPGSSVGGVIEVTDVDGPDSDTDEGDHLGQLLTEFVELLGEGGLDLFRLSHLVSDLTDSSGSTSADDNAPGFTGGDIGSGEPMFFLSWLTALGSGTGSQCLMTETDSP